MAYHSSRVQICGVIVLAGVIILFTPFSRPLRHRAKTAFLPRKPRRVSITSNHDDHIVPFPQDQVVPHLSSDESANFSDVSVDKGGFHPEPVESSIPSTVELTSMPSPANMEPSVKAPTGSVTGISRREKQDSLAVLIPHLTLGSSRQPLLLL